MYVVPNLSINHEWKKESVSPIKVQLLPFCHSLQNRRPSGGRSGLSVQILRRLRQWGLNLVTQPHRLQIQERTADSNPRAQRFSVGWCGTAPGQEYRHRETMGGSFVFRVFTCISLDFRCTILWPYRPTEEWGVLWYESSRREHVQVVNHCCKFYHSAAPSTCTAHPFLR